jgi:uncharacterized protein
MENSLEVQKISIWVKIGAVLLFILFSLVIMIVFSPWHPLLKPSPDLFGRIGLITLLGGCTWLAKKHPAFTPLWPILSALTTMSVAVSMMWLTGNYLVDHVGLSASEPGGFALLKLNDMVVVFVVVLVLSRLAGFKPADLYLQKGKVRLGLLLGLGTFIVAAAISIPSGIFMFKLDPAKLAGWREWLPWLALFVLANGAMEEMLFRGLFLKKFEPLLGEFLSILTIALVFTALHFGVNYTSQQLIFMGILIGLALLFGTVIQKTRSLWPAILFHAGMDISVMLGIFSSMK